MLVPQGKLGCCYKQENGQTLIRQARKTPQGFSSLAVEMERHLSGKLLASANLVEADGAPGDQDGGGWRMLSGAEEAVPEDEKYEVRRCMCQERNWRDVVRSTSLAESAPRELSECCRC